MEWAIVFSLLGVGLLLVIAEIFLMPGTNLSGIAGMVLTIAAVVMGFIYFGAGQGLMFAGISIALFVLLLFAGFRSKTWQKGSLKDVIGSRVNDDRIVQVQEGETGEALSNLRPFGNVQFGEDVYEAQSAGPYIESGSKVRVVHIKSSRIIVEPIAE